jgi:hypothetical protein
VTRLGRLPHERPDVPPTGWKVAFPVLARDSSRAGFRGVSLGGRIVYTALDTARCGFGRRHASPSRRCECGFYCLATAAEAHALACATDCRGAVVLQVSVLGAYTRYERGLRYERQRVRTVRVGACRCGRQARAFVRNEPGPGAAHLTGVPGVPGLPDGGDGDPAGPDRPVWLPLTATCAACAGGLRMLPLAEFARLAGPWVTVTTSTADRTVLREAPGS